MSKRSDECTYTAPRKNVRNDEARFEQFTNGWVRSGFNWQTTRLSVRRVRPSGATEDEVQIGVMVVECKGQDGKRRCFEKHAGLSLNSEQAELLARHILELASDGGAA